MHDLTTVQRFWYVVRRVLTSPLSLALWVAGVVGAILLRDTGPVGLLAPILLAVAAQGALIFGRLHDEEFLRRLFAEREDRAETLNDQQVESLLERMDFETRQRIRYILQLQKELVQEARSSDSDGFTRQSLRSIAGQVSPVVQRAVKLATRKQQLGRYLHIYDERALQSYCSNLRQRIQATTDPVTKAQYEQALKARESEVQAYQALAQAAGRIDSQLENVEATLASWKAKVIRIKAADVSSVASVSQELYQELELLNSDIDTLDKSVSQALAGDDTGELRLNQQ